MFWVWDWKISPKIAKFFNFYPSGKKKSLWVGSKSTWVKGRAASYLLRVKSMIGSGRVRAHLYNRKPPQLEESWPVCQGSCPNKGIKEVIKWALIDT